MPFSVIEIRYGNKDKQNRYQMHHAWLEWHFWLDEEDCNEVQQSIWSLGHKSFLFQKLVISSKIIYNWFLFRKYEPSFIANWKKYVIDKMVFGS